MKCASQVSYAIVSEYIYLFIRKSNCFMRNLEVLNIAGKLQQRKKYIGFLITENKIKTKKLSIVRLDLRAEIHARIFFALTTQSARIQGSLVN